MIRVFVLLILFSTTLNSCAQKDGSSAEHADDGVNDLTEKELFIDRSKGTIVGRFPSPLGFQRNFQDSNSFAYNLRHLPLKNHGSKVLHYNGTIKEDRGVYLAVVQKEIGKKDLHQCADAVMRLRADYFYGRKEFDKIHFNFTNGFRVDFSEWVKGKRIKLEGNNTNWVNRENASHDEKTYWQYMEQIFMYAGTLSLDQELISVKIIDMKIGDVFIKGGSPGHAVIVVDMVENLSGQKKFILAQSYMPAQEIQVLRNPANKEQDNPWYDLTEFEVLSTPEWSFMSNQLKRFAD